LVDKNKLLGVDIKKKSLTHPLVLDVSSPSIQVGIAKTDGWIQLASSQNQALDGIFQLVQQLEINLHNVDSIFFCAGPGSTLGLRLALAFIKTLEWERKGELRLFSYNALDLACRMAEHYPSYLQAPFRLGWRLVRSSPTKKAIGKIEIFEREEALKNFPDSLHLEDSRDKSTPITTGNFLKYDLNKTKGLEDLFLVSEAKKELKVFSPLPPKFKKWNPQIKFLSS
jgi:hypothetical protein